jgi:hypothetical protein
MKAATTFMDNRYSAFFTEAVAVESMNLPDAAGEDRGPGERT